MQRLVQVRVVGGDGGVEGLLGVLKVAGHVGAVHRYVRDLALVGEVLHLRQADRRIVTARSRATDELPDGDQASQHQYPDQDGLHSRIQRCYLFSLGHGAMGAAALQPASPAYTCPPMIRRPEEPLVAGEAGAERRIPIRRAFHQILLPLLWMQALPFRIL